MSLITQSSRNQNERADLLAKIAGMNLERVSWKQVSLASAAAFSCSTHYPRQLWQNVLNRMWRMLLFGWKPFDLGSNCQCGVLWLSHTLKSPLLQRPLSPVKRGIASKAWLMQSNGNGMQKIIFCCDQKPFDFSSNCQRDVLWLSHTLKSPLLLQLPFPLPCTWPAATHRL